MNQKSIILTITLFLNLILMESFAQNYEPSIVVLLPNEVIIEKKLQKEIEKANQELKKLYKESLVQDEYESEERLKTVSKGYKWLSENMSYVNYVSFITNTALMLGLTYEFENGIAYTINQKSTYNLQELEAIANKNQVQFVISFPKLEVYTLENEKYLKARIILYDKKSNKILLDKESTGNSRKGNKKFDFEDGNIICTVDNVIMLSLNELGIQISNNLDIVKQKRQLQKSREKILLDNYFNQSPNQEILQIIARAEPKASLDGYYQCIMDASKTKFVAFFIVKDDSKFLMASKSQGIYYQNRWYVIKDKGGMAIQEDDIEKGKKWHFSRLIEEGFFKEYSVELNPDFWETNLFAKVESQVLLYKKQIDEYQKIIKESDNEDLKKMYKWKIERHYQTDIENAPYMGLYEIVADKLKKR